MSHLTNSTRHALPDFPGYTVVEQLYLGSRTVVYRAVHNSSQRSVVIKQLRRDYPGFGELVQFHNQYAIAKALPLAGIVRPLSLEVVGNSYALVMEDGAGIALGQYAQQQLNVAEVLAIAVQLATILHDLHQHRVIHKDIKPANILIHPESKRVKLIDFSIASLLPKETQAIQSPSILEGTLAYLAPEQTGRMNRGIDYRADFYALGVTLYQLLTRTVPFTTANPLELIHCHIAKQPQPVDQVNPAVPKLVAAIVTKLMSKNAEDRYQSGLGLKHDLQQCLTQWREKSAIAEFALGARDLSDRFLIPEKLYGREAEVQALLAAFDRVSGAKSGRVDAPISPPPHLPTSPSPRSELMLVAGLSGIGKTAVVNEVHKPITRQQGYFIKGKFDQFNRNIPLSAFVQALQDLIGQLLCESDAQLRQWKTKILEAVGENGQVLIDIIPELEQMIGKQPSVAELSGSAAQNRFNLLFGQFVQVFTTAEHPLVLFLDDLQWADSASLQLIKLLMQDQGHLLLLGAYRDNEVSAAHPFILMVEELKKTATIVRTITLTALAFQDTNRLIAHTLNCPLNRSQPLSELIVRKTQGNPFFTTQFLKALHSDGYIRFNREQRYWECDIAQISMLSLTDDVVEFMAEQLQKLPAQTQQVLKLAACIGSQFDLATLAVVSQQSATDAATALWKALQEGLILPTSQIYKFFQSDDAEVTDAHSAINPTYRFLHDRVQQAAYSLIPDDQKQAIHLQIGRSLRQATALDGQDENTFAIANHLNKGASLITDEQEQQQLVHLNLKAGQKARNATAYGAAFNYYQIGIALLRSDHWQRHYDLTLSLYAGAAESAYLNTDFEQVEPLAQVVLDHAQSWLDRSGIYLTKIQTCIAQNQLQEALQLAREVLTHLGVQLPEQPTPADIQQAFEQTLALLAGREIESLLELPQMTAAHPKAAMMILSNIFALAYRVAPDLFPLVILAQVNLSVQHGNAPESTYAYVLYGSMQSGQLNDIETGYRFGLLGVNLLDRIQASKLYAKTIFGFYAFLSHWKEPLKNTLSGYLHAYTKALETGDLEYVGISLMCYEYAAYLCGQELTTLRQAIEEHRKVIQQFGMSGHLDFLTIYYHIVLNLMEPTVEPEQLFGEQFDEAISIQRYLEANESVMLFQVYVYKLFLSYLFGQYDQAIANARLTQQYLAVGTGLPHIAPFYFYSALVQLAVYPDASDVDKAVILEQVAVNLEKLTYWAVHAPSNQAHRCALIVAERCRVLGQKAEAIDLYDRAIAGAKANGYTQEEAIANELAAKFYMDWGKEKVSASYMQDAYYAYAHWGAKAKVQDLERRYPKPLAPILQQQRLALSTTETIFATAARLPASSTQASSGSTSISATLDLATILKASQTLSSEIQLDKFLATLLHTVLETAGADKAVLLMPHEQQWCVEAVATLGQPARVKSIALSDSLEIPHRLIHSVKRRLQPAVIVDVAADTALATDAYVQQQQPQSLLCMPILHQGKLVAILYLENRAAVGAFTGDRVKLLNFLCAQAAISLENARLYQQAQTYAQQLEQSQLQIIHSEKMASLGNLVAGIAHEINNPIGFLNGSINNARDYVQDLLSHLALYQQHHANPAAPVQDHAQEIDLEFLSKDLPKLLSSMKGATDRITNISTSLRTFSRADTEHKVSANLHEGLDSTLLILKYRLNANECRSEIKVVRDYGNLPLIECFPGQLNQVFMNILANAIDTFDEMAQTQSLEQLKTNSQKITIQTEQRDNRVLICIRDNGKGMSEEIQAKIFDHLFTTKAVGKGTGLGLVIARQIVVKKHGGQLEVESELGRGTEFSISLPIWGCKSAIAAVAHYKNCVTAD